MMSDEKPDVSIGLPKSAKENIPESSIGLLNQEPESAIGRAKYDTKKTAHLDLIKFFKSLTLDIEHLQFNELGDIIRIGEFVYHEPLNGKKFSIFVERLNEGDDSKFRMVCHSGPNDDALWTMIEILSKQIDKFGGSKTIALTGSDDAKKTMEKACAHFGLTPKKDEAKNNPSTPPPSPPTSFKR